MLKGIFVFFTLMLFGCTTILPHQHVLPKPRHALRFATYNVYWKNSSKNKHNPHSIISLIKEINPDIIALQETYCFSANRLKKHFKKTHPYYLFRSCNHNGNEDGLGLLSKYPIVKNIYFPAVYGWFPGWLYVIKTPKGYLQVLNVHLNPRLVCDNNIGIFAEGIWATPKFRLMEISYYYKYLNPCLPTIIAGDFNEGDNGAAVNFLRRHCFRDLLMMLPNHIKTWRYQWACFNFSERYDRIYCTSDIHPYRRCQVLQKGYSDHFPVVIDFVNVHKK